MKSARTLYEELIRDFCRAARIDDWEHLAQTQHIAIGDRLVGLVADLDEGEPVLSVCIELGETFPERDGALYQRLLAANLAVGSAACGHYGLHAESRQAVFCMRFSLDAIDGAELAAVIDEALRSHRLEDLALTA